MLGQQGKADVSEDGVAEDDVTDAAAFAPALAPYRGLTLFSVDWQGQGLSARRRP
jgi:hypothetical protein